MIFLSDASEIFETRESWLNLASGCYTEKVRSQSILLASRLLEYKFQSRIAYLSSEAWVVVVVMCVCLCMYVCVHAPVNIDPQHCCETFLKPLLLPVPKHR